MSTQKCYMTFLSSNLSQSIVKIHSSLSLKPFPSNIIDNFLGTNNENSKF